MLDEFLLQSEWEKCTRPVIVLDESRLQFPTSGPEAADQVHYVVYHCSRVASLI